VVVIPVSAALRIGVVGLGRAAASMLPSLAAHPHVAVAAAADPNAEARERFARDFDAPAYASIAELCERAAIDAVYIATPHQRHVADAIVAAAYGKHMIVEKPMALTLEDCDAMTRAAERARVAVVVGHTHAFDPAVVCMREIIRSRELGALRSIVNVVYTNFLYRPRREEELDTERGGGIMFNQVPHQVDIARALDGGRLRSVRATAGVWDASRPTEGALSALLDFDSGATASLVYSGYDRFDTDEFHDWVGEMGEEKSPNTHGATRRALRAETEHEDEAAVKARSGFAGRGPARRPGGPVHHPHFGMLLVSCERGDMRPSPDGVWIYGETETREVKLPEGRAYPNKDAVVDELYDAVVHGRPPLHDASWGTATVAAGLALLQSSRERREVFLEAGAAYA
jgi:phthalate 4,5-cis-dihydrodiol dehydrogenase